MFDMERHPARPLPRTGPTDGQPHRFLLVVDDDEAWRDAARWLREPLAADPRRTLTLLVVAEPAALAAWASEDMDLAALDAEELLARQRAQLAMAAARTLIGLPERRVQEIFCIGRLHLAVRAELARRPHAAIVVGRGRTLWLDRVFGRDREIRRLCGLGCPVVIVPRAAGTVAPFPANGAGDRARDRLGGRASHRPAAPAGRGNPAPVGLRVVRPPRGRQQGRAAQP